MAFKHQNTPKEELENGAPAPPHAQQLEHIGGVIDGPINSPIERYSS
ncbi:hypothetical protein [Bradyrhizobium sp. Arg816]|nr:hypothetical protein [Bradyrhizobium sp. Arg816]MDI3565546.1 hypothetical protein [Bradyrhizobium sp. Arg816]